MATYRLDVEYEGTRYHGWQEQKNARSVAGELRAALEQAGAQVLELGGSGRTDAGVHALRQTAHLRLRQDRPAAPLRLTANDHLPSDIQILGLWPASDAFHARHDAIARSYVYQLSRRRSALGKRWVWWIKRPLDVERLRAAAANVEGRHDFKRLCERPGTQPSTIVVVERVEVVEDGDLILVRFVASHFLWKMVRRIVGVLARIGVGETPGETLREMIQDPDGADDGGAARSTAPPSGLFLERVVYPGEPAIAPLVAAVPVARGELAASATFLGARRPSARSSRPKRTGGASGRRAKTRH